MCGIAVWFDPEGGPADPAWLEAAAGSLIHRGPDESGVHSEPGLGMAFRRLSIVDLQTGSQPLSNEDGTVWIVFNGEIYNHADLHRELESRGHRYRTRSDTESIAHAYEEWGERCVERLRGMFAFAIWDRKERRLFVARDRVGIKPLYIARTGRAILCASEIKALLAHPGVRRAVRIDGLVEHLTLRYAPSPRTLFDGIEKLPPGHFLSVDENGERLERYWQVAYEPKASPRIEDALDELDGRLEEAVRLRLMSDVPLGALLSGGLDSSVVVAIMSRLLERPVQTFSVGFDAPGPYSELAFARRVAEHCRTEHREILVGPADVLRELPQLAWHQDEPISEPAAIPTFLVSKLARETVTVVLTGEGGDELFAGYPKYAADPIARRIAHLPAALRDGLAGALAKRLPFGFRKLQVMARSAGLADEGERYASWFAGFAGPERAALLSPLLRQHEGSAAAAFRDVLAATQARRPLDRMLDADLQLWLPDDLLMKVDKMSMAASVEARVPLLDHPLIEWSAGLPDRFKTRGLVGKVLLKRLGDRLLPREIVHRRKVGFTVPLAPWFRGPLRPLLEDALLSPASLARGYFDASSLRGYVADHVEGRRDRSRELWTLLTLELWHRAFIDHPPRRPVPFQMPARAPAVAR